MEIVNGEGQVQIHLKTKQEQYAVPDVPYSIEGSVTTTELNALLDTLLNQNTIGDDQISVEFDFLVADEYLKGRLCDHLRDKEISFEDTIDIEYVERFPAPEPQDCLLHDDWVAGVHTYDDWIVTGCYDNSVNIWNTKGKHVLTIPGHVLSVKAVSWISVDAERGTFISASQDQTAMLWEWMVESNTAECIAVCKGHERGIDCVNVSPDKKRFATGSWDTMLKIWSAETDEPNESSKRAKEKGSTRTPILTLQGHRECVSAVQWCDSETVLSSCWDHTMKIWDLNLEGVKAEISTNKAIFDASYSNLNHLIVTASADRNVRLYDSRTNKGSVVRNTYLGHTEWVTSVCWSTTEEHLFVSSSYDNKNKLWDCRSPKAPLYDMLGHSDKVLSIDWSNPRYIISGGADNSVRVFKSKKATQLESMDTK